jgi:hypothetical protein
MTIVISIIDPLSDEMGLEEREAFQCGFIVALSDRIGIKRTKV